MKFLCVVLFMSNIFCSDVLILGHRGAKGIEPENTLLAFQKAAEYGADGIEFDVQLCKSGEDVIFHDDDTLQITGQNYLIAESTVAELKSLDVGKGQQIPTLGELLDFVHGKFKILNVELKGPGSAGPVVKKIEKLVASGKWSYSDFVVTSFKWNEIEDVCSLSSDIIVGLLMKEDLEWQAMAKKVNAKYLVVDVKIINEQIVKQAISAGLSAWVFTVNDLDDSKRLIEMGVTGLITDFPNLITKTKLEN